MGFRSTIHLSKLGSSEVLALILETEKSLIHMHSCFVGEHKMHRLAGTSRELCSHLLRKRQIKS